MITWSRLTKTRSMIYSNGKYISERSVRVTHWSDSIARLDKAKSVQGTNINGRQVTHVHSKIIDDTDKLTQWHLSGISWAASGQTTGRSDVGQPHWVIPPLYSPLKHRSARYQQTIEGHSSNSTWEQHEKKSSVADRHRTRLRIQHTYLNPRNCRKDTRSAFSWPHRKQMKRLALWLHDEEMNWSTQSKSFVRSNSYSAGDRFSYGWDPLLLQRSIGRQIILITR